MIKYLMPVAATLALFSAPASAEVKNLSEQGFLVIHGAEVSAKPEDVWKRLLIPKDWWQPAHSWSGSVDGFYIDPQAGGCFCELVQEKDKAGKIVNKGSVEHMRVIFAQPGRVLRMQGALGPLQSEAVMGTLTIAIEPSGTGSKLSFNYIVGGYSRFPMDKMAPAVDRVLAEQFAALIKPLAPIAMGAEAAKAGQKSKAGARSVKIEDTPKLDAVVEAIEPEPKEGKPEVVEPDRLEEPR
ncbi:MAG: hypothetical protein ACRCY3_12900 [Sphingorhabdus sp.]